MKEQDDRLISMRLFGLFLETINAELGNETLSMILEKASLPADHADPQAVSRFTTASAAEAYARIQQAIRAYYGRGARGILTRIGRLLWVRLLETATLAEKTQAQIVRIIPASMRLKPALELLARLVGERPVSITIHTLDLDLLLVDHAAPLTIGQEQAFPICYVTLGLLQEALYWATGQEQEIEERCCRATGASQCEFKITLSSS